MLTISGDISQPATTDRIIGEALDRFGRIDTLINNAGIFIAKPFTDYTADDYASVVARQPDRIFHTDSAGHRRNAEAKRRPHCQHHDDPRRLRKLQRAIGSGRTHEGRCRFGHQVTGDRVRLSRHPGQRCLTGRHPDADECSGNLRRTRRAPPRRPLGPRLGQVSDIVDGILFLELSPFITGEILHIDGGQSAGH